MAVEVTPAAGARRGTTVLVPPWKLPRLALVSGWAALAARAGNEVWTLVPPLHLQRAPPGTRSGEAFVTPDLPALRAAFEQLVLELRLLLALARARGQPVGLLGLSLGGLAAALAATTPEAPERCALVAPPADLRSVALETRIGRRLLRPLGSPLPPEALADMLRPFGPGERRPRAGRVLVAVGAADAIALPGPAEALARAWGAELRAYPRGHLTLLFACRAVRRDVQELLRPPA